MVAAQVGFAPARERLFEQFDVGGNERRDVLATIDLARENGLARAGVVLVGHSMGGAIAARLALDQPMRVASLTLIASAGLGDEINVGYGHLYNEAVAKLDGVAPRDMEDFVARLSAAHGVVEIEDLGSSNGTKDI